MDFNGMKRKDLQSLCKTYGIPANTKNSEMATRLASRLASLSEENFKLMERKDLQTLCKKHGIPANLKNNEMATRLASLFQVGRISAGYCVNQETLDEVNDVSLTKAELIFSTERDCKLNVLELSGSLSTKEENVSVCLEEDDTSIHRAANNAPERNLMSMEQLSEFGKICAAETVTQHNDEASKSHAVVFTTPEQVLLLGDSELYEVGKEEEHTEADSLDESDFLSSSQNEAVNEDESIIVEHHDEPIIAASPQKHSSVGDSMVPVCHVAAPDFRENTISDSSGSIAHKVSYIPEFNAEEKTAVEEFAIIDEPIEAKVTKNSQRDYNGNILLDSSGGSSVNGNICVFGGMEDEHLGCNSEEAFRKTCEKSGCKIIKDEATCQTATPFVKAMSLTPSEFTGEDNIMEEGLEAAQGTSKQSRLHSPHINSVTLSDFDTKETEITMAAERNVTLSSYVLASSAEGDSKTIGEISSILDVGGTCSMVSEESVPSTDIQNQTNNALVELAITDNNETDELNEAKVTKNLDSSGGSPVLEQTCVLGGTEDELLCFFETAADEEMVKRGAALSPEEALNESSENKECANIGESGTLSEKQVSREPNLIYRTQVKHKRHDMKENAPHSNIVENLNVRTSKRQPLQDLRNIREEPNKVFKKPKTSQPKHNSPQKTCNKEVSVLFTAHNIQTGNRFAVLSDIDDC